ncbi:hypothetical protein BHM03_00021591 [Ensete ventricosum]|uniref:Uncharacterized protein n=1 Tax=Ensete ventricosum TaxID=4639 RepID=A0A445MG60_ENSVE|nr:hypothetical protein BHM03_00021591 [Ensete ventricosum]
MLPLRFPNSGIRAKVFVGKIGFKLRVMRLHRVELFYTFLLRFHSEGNEERGWLATAKPSARGRSAVAKASCRGSRPWLDHLQGWLATARPPGGVAAMVIQLVKAKLGSGDLSMGQDDAETGIIEAARELDCFSTHIRLREPDKSEDKAEYKTTDSRAMGLAAPWYRKGETSVESSIPCSHGGRAFVVKGAEEVENVKANFKY